jgi:type II secretory ATPase GspE/PulE/Tfp pilus assembly ATPase PilB-like protein
MSDLYDTSDDTSDDQATSLSMIAEDRIPSTFQAMRGEKNKLEIFAVNFLNELFKYALLDGISDVHFESAERSSICRIRKNGSLSIYRVLDDIQYSAIREKLYQRARVDEAYAKNHVTDSRAWLRFDNRVDLRISTLPTTHGFSIVIRLLDQANSGRKLEDLDLPEPIYNASLTVIKSAHGMIVLSGPTGSGKTTTLSAYINQINSPEIKIVAIEDPPEYSIPNVQHVAVTPNISMADALRSAMRQDPDVILIGEIRDFETAQIAVRAAQTGHLVLTTVHANSSVATITRLLELGIEPTNLNETLLAVCAQRIVRKSKSVQNTDLPNEFEREWLRRNNRSDLIGKPFGRGNNPKFYSGRIPVVEMLLITDEIKDAISSNNLSEIYNLATKQPQYKTLTNAALDLALQGKTSLEQAISISKASTQMILDGLMLGDRLLALNYITPTQLSYAQSQVQKNSLVTRTSLREFLVEHHFCTVEQILECRDAPDF